MAVLVGAVTAFAADFPLDGTKLGIHERAGRTPRSDVMCRDASVVLPGPGGAGDPSLGGATIEITIDAGGAATFIAPPGAGWKVGTAPLSYLYKNNLAPAGGSSVKRLLLRDGKLVKLSVRGATIGAASPAGGADVRITFGNDDVLCARFPSSSIVKDQPGTLIAKNAPAPAFCTAPTTSSTSTTAVSTTTVTSTSLYPPCSGGSAPACDGTCVSGDSCRNVLTVSAGSVCICVPDALPSCGMGYPTCGGACDGGNACMPFREIFPAMTTFCACAPAGAVCQGGPSPEDPTSVCTPGACPPGLVCGFALASGGQCGCTTP